jgi:trans-aconitate methyltransferase
MDLADQYRHQYSWRDWQTAYETLPPLQGKTVLDLGCGVGDQSADLARLGATMVGVDANAQLVAAAESRGVPGTAFQTADLRQLQALGLADGIWSSFTAAYFTDLTPVLSRWREWLSPGGWIALTEVDDLFGHQPLPSRARDILDSFTAEALHAEHYDFFIGRKLATHMKSIAGDPFGRH